MTVRSGRRRRRDASSRRGGNSWRGRWRRRRPASRRCSFGQLYISIADPAADGSLPARLYWKPLVTLIWLGALLMAFGGAVSLADRRLRFGAPRARARPRGGDGAGLT